MAPEIEVPEQEVHTRNIPWAAIWAVIAFMVGTIFSAGLGWGRSSDSIDQMTRTLARLEGSIDTLTDKYNISDKNVYGELQRIEMHLSYDDGRLDRLESREK